MGSKVEKTHNNIISSTLLSAISWLLKPLVRLCIDKGISYPQLRNLLKQTYIDVADQSFTLDEQRASDSRIFLLTGIHRKDVKRLRSETGQEPEAFKTSTLGGELVAHWMGLPEFLDDQGQPRNLLRTTTEAAVGFDQLLAGVSKDIRPKVVIDEWLRLGIITEVDENQLQLNQHAFVPQQGFEEKAWYLGRNMHDHFAACCFNLLNTTADPMLERSVYYTSLSPQSIAILRNAAAEQANELLQSLNRQALALQQQDQDNPQAHYRMRFGAYWFEDDTQTTKKTQ